MAWALNRFQGCAPRLLPIPRSLEGDGKKGCKQKGRTRIPDEKPADDPPLRRPRCRTAGFRVEAWLTSRVRSGEDENENALPRRRRERADYGGAAR